MMSSTGGSAAGPRLAGSGQLTYQGGYGSVGIQSAPSLYLVYWDWQGSDPSGEGPYLENFYRGVGGSDWNGSVTQYCQGVAVGTVQCGNSGTHAGNPAGMLKGVWHDDGDAEPNGATQAQLGNEAVVAAAHFGLSGQAQLGNVQVIVASPSGLDPSGFGSSYCAWHSWVDTGNGLLPYTNLPYATDAGASCGQGFVNFPGTLDGVSMMAGHEMAETETDPLPNTGWLDSVTYENGDKCAWISPGSGQGSAQDVSFSTGSFAVQSLWSNAFSNGVGGCVVTMVQPYLTVLQQPTATLAGAAITPAVRIAEYNSQRQLNSSDNSTVISIGIGTNPTGAALFGTTSQTVSGGIATFSDLSIQKAASGYTLTATGPNLVPVTTTGFPINPGSASAIAFVQQPTDAPPGQLLAPSVTVGEVDAYGNVNHTDSTLQVTVAIGANPGGGTLSGTVSRTASRGIATFNDLSVSNVGTGYTLSAGAPSMSTVASAAFNVGVTPAGSTAFLSEPANSVAGSPIAPAVTVALLDTKGRLETADNATQVTVGLATNPGHTTMGGTLTRTVSAGVASFNDLVITRAATGYALGSASGATTPGLSALFNVVGAAPASMFLGVSVDGGGTVVLPAQGVTVTSYLQDRYGNPAYTPSIHFTLIDPSGLVKINDQDFATDSTGVLVLHLSLYDTAAPGTYTVITSTHAPAPVFRKVSSYTVLV
ncbi:MAG: hypothetical protein ACYDAY_03210 [Candidatus Dormibacteria bacterium]